MNHELTKHTLNLRQGDMDFISQIALPRGVAASLIVRTLVSRYVDRMRSREAEPDLNIDIGDLLK